MRLFALLLISGGCEGELVDFIPQASDCLVAFEAPVVAPSTRAEGGYDRDALYSSTFPVDWSFKLSARMFTPSQSFADLGWSGGVAWADDAVFSCDDPSAAYPVWSGGVYWPKEAVLALCAAYPADEGVIGSSGLTYGTAEQPYELSLDGGQKDLMYGERFSGQSAAGDPLQMDLRHALASVVFTVRTDREYEAPIRIKSIVLDNIKYKGVFDQSLGDGATGAGSPQWTGQTGLGGYDNIILTPSGIEVAYDCDPGQAGAQALTLWTQSEVADLLVIPQGFADARLNIEYSISGGAGGEILQHYSARLSDMVFDTAGVTGFEMGRKYIFNIIISRTKIYFAPQVGNWTSIVVG